MSLERTYEIRLLILGQHFSVVACTAICDKLINMLIFPGVVPEKISLR